MVSGQSSVTVIIYLSKVGITHAVLVADFDAVS